MCREIFCMSLTGGRRNIKSLSNHIFFCNLTESFGFQPLCSRAFRCLEDMVHAAASAGLQGSEGVLVETISEDSTSDLTPCHAHTCFCSRVATCLRGLL